MICIARTLLEVYSIGDPPPSFPSLCEPGTNMGAFLLGVICVLAVLITPDSGQKKGYYIIVSFKI